MSKSPYKMSFSTGGLNLPESIILSCMYLELNDWKLVREKAIAENILQARTISSLKRVCREVISRLKKLDDDELSFLVETNSIEQGYLLWIAVCRHYRFIAEFATEVLRERYISLKHDLTHEDFDIFYNQKSDWHMELEEIQPSTRKKLRQVLFRMLREAGLLGTNKMINAVMLSPMFIKVIVKTDSKELLYFPVFESEISEGCI